MVALGWRILPCDLCVWRKLSRAETDHGFYPSTLITHYTQRGRARTASRPAFMDIIIEWRRLYFYLISNSTASNLKKEREKKTRSENNRGPDMTLVCGLRGCFPSAICSFRSFPCRAVWCPSPIRGSLKFILILFSLFFKGICLCLFCLRMSCPSAIC